MHFEEEARTIGEEIEQLQRGGHHLNEMAILVRASFQMRGFQDRFVTLAGPAYRVIGGPRFYERAEIRYALAYLRVVNSPADDLAFERIVNVPKRGWEMQRCRCCTTTPASAECRSPKPRAPSSRPTS